jgi:hypothetical protein
MACRLNEHTMSRCVITYNGSMKVMVRRVGNSLGILLPKLLLETWGIGEGDHLDLSEHGLRAAGLITHETVKGD